MSSAPTQQVNRLDRRKARTRAALIAAAQKLIAEGRTNVPVLEITQAADVGMGSFTTTSRPRSSCSRQRSRQ